MRLARTRKIPLRQEWNCWNAREKDHIKGKVPLNTSKDYASEVSSYTKGLGTFMVKPCGYQITKGGYSDNTRMEEKDKLLFMFEKSVSSK